MHKVAQPKRTHSNHTAMNLPCSGVHATSTNEQSQQEVKPSLKPYDSTADCQVQHVTFLQAASSPLDSLLTCKVNQIETAEHNLGQLTLDL